MHKASFLIPLSFLLLSSCKSKKDPVIKPNPPTLVDVIIARTKTISHTIEANGSVVANEYVELHPEISGRITYLYVPEGAHVVRGALIARINDADLQATLAKSKVQLDLYEKTETRLGKLLAVNGVNQADYDAAVNNVGTTKADIQYTQAQIDKTIISAPFNGLVGLRQVSIGGYVTPANVIATVQQVDKLKIDFTIPEEYSPVIKIGNTVDVQTDALAKTARKATIIATEPQVNQATRNLKVRAILDNNGKLNPGSFVKVTLSTGPDTRAVMVPTNAIIPNDQSNQLILVKNGKAVFVNIQTGVREASNVEITKGVAVGDTIVVTGVLFAKAKAPVHIQNVKSLDKVAATDSGKQAAAPVVRTAK